MSLIVRVAARGDGIAEDGRHAALAAPGDELRDDGTIVPTAPNAAAAGSSTSTTRRGRGSWSIASPARSTRTR